MKVTRNYAEGKTNICLGQKGLGNQQLKLYGRPVKAYLNN